MSKDQFSLLLDKYLQDRLSEEELPEFLAQAKLEDNLPLLNEVVLRSLEEKQFLGQSDKSNRSHLFNDLLQKASEEKESKPKESVVLQPRKTSISFFRFAAAAVLLLLVGTIGYLYVSSANTTFSSSEKTALQKTDIKPGGNKAILTLADGSQLVLDNANEGTISNQGNSKVIKLNNGQIAYKPDNSGSAQTLYNTISTPKGGTYQIILPDNSKVWLNALSSLRFPTAFTDKERRVEVTGEAYFEVAKDKTKPFVVKVNEMEVKVLGTHFNIMAYPEEMENQTTLLEGSVQVNAGSKSALLKPNQQLQNNRDNSDFDVVNNVDADEVVAWKNGFFQYDNTDLGTIMRQLGRWYDVTPRFQNSSASATLFTGKISRNQSLDNVLSILKLSGINFEVSGREIIVKS